MKKVLFVLLTGLFVSYSFAQVNFSGGWKLKEKEHISGPEYKNAMAHQLKIEQRTDSLIIESTNVGEDDKDVVSRQALVMDSMRHTATSLISKRKYIRNLAWTADKKTLMITTVYYVPENANEIDFERMDMWSLENGQLVIKRRSVEGRSESWEVKGVYERQADSQ